MSNKNITMADSDTDRLKAQDTLMKTCVAKLTGVIRDPECPATKIRNELKPFDAFAWSPKLVQLVGISNLNTMFLLLRQSKLPKKDYRKLRGKSHHISPTTRRSTPRAVRYGETS